MRVVQVKTIAPTVVARKPFELRAHEAARAFGDITGPRADQSRFCLMQKRLGRQPRPIASK